MIPAVWAASAAAVDLHVATGTEPVTRPMRRGREGWWRAEDRLAPGTDYAFAVDGGPPRPDPRSAWQPHGVHGPSRVVDLDVFRWTDGSWRGRDARGAITYELHVGTFTPEGTLDAAIERLDHLVDLGVQMVELLPVAAFNGRRGWGYDGVHLYAVHHPYGGPSALQRFVDAAHARGLGVCLDVVYNHLGPSGNYLAEFGPYFTDRHRTPWGPAVNLDGAGAAEVRRWVCDNALRWFRDFHVDALRLDAVHALVDDSAVHLLAQLATEVGALSSDLGRPLSLVAESDLNDARMVTPAVDGGLGMTAQWADDVHHAVHALLTGERHGYYVDFGSPQTLRTALTRAFVHAGGFSTFRGRTWGAPVPEDVGGHRFVVCVSNHDQVGNRALGDRPSGRRGPGAVVAGLSEDDLAAAAALVLLGPFTPLIFMGEEWGARTPWMYFTDHPEPDLADAVRAGRRAEFGAHGWEELYGGAVAVPDPQDPATFEASRLDWSERDGPRGARLLRWYRTLIRLREVPDIASGDRSRTALEWGEDVWLMLRRGDVAVAINRTDEEIPLPPGVATGVLLAAWGQASAGTTGLLGPHGIVVTRRDPG